MLEVLRRCCLFWRAGHPGTSTCVTFLLEHGADASAQSSRGDNALHVAAKNGSTACLQALLASRAPPGARG